MNLGDLRPNPGAKHRSKRVGRGIGSGHGKTSCRGSKGSTPNTVRRGFEGGQTPLHRRLPCFRGFTNNFRTEYAILNLDQLERFEEGTVVTPELLVEQRIVRDLKDGVKILGDGKLTKALTVRAHKFSKSAAEQIAARGGTVEAIGAGSPASAAGEGTAEVSG